MTYYEKKRRSKGIDTIEVARLLEIDYPKYVKIEKGEMKMPTKLLDKFNEIMNKGKNELQLSAMNRQKEVNEWYDNMIANKRANLHKKMIDFNIDSYAELTKLMNYGSGSTFSKYVNKRIPTSYNFKERLYSFFENELNIQPVKKSENSKTKAKSKIGPNRSKKAIEFYKNFNIKEWMKKNGMQYRQFAESNGISPSTLYYYINPKSKKTVPTEYTINKVMNAVEKYEQLNNIQTSYDETKKEEIKMKNKSTNSLNNKYNARLSALSEEKIKLENEIVEINKRINQIEELETIYQEFITELYKLD